jgi:hypothetical protein
MILSRSSDVFRVTFKDLKVIHIVYLDKPPIRDLYQIVEGPTPGIFYIGARGHLLVRLSMLKSISLAT